MGFRAVLAKLVMDQIGLARETGVIDRGMLETEGKSLMEAVAALSKGESGQIQCLNLLGRLFWPYNLGTSQVIIPVTK